MSCIATRQPHRLMDIMSKPSSQGPGVTYVVRWCRDCGAVACDIDVDGRTQPGAELAMVFPTLARRITQVSR